MRPCSLSFSARETATVPPAAWRWPIPVSLRILCIEDDPIAQREIVAELSRAGFLVEAVADGAEGFKRALEGDYAAVTLDRNLPSMDGLEVVRRLREEGRVTPVLMISAFSDVDDRVRGLRAGGDDYLAKPFAATELLARVNALYESAGAEVQAAREQGYADGFAEGLDRASARRCAARPRRPARAHGAAFPVQHAPHPTRNRLHPRGSRRAHRARAASRPRARRPDGSGSASPRR